MSEGLYGWTSMWDLCIVQSEVNYPDVGPHLRVSAVSESELEFRYIDTAVLERQWTRVVPWDAAWDRFLVFLEQLHWFSDLDRQSLLRNPLI